nr:hypothetical protein [uncultured Pseudomonas sp.]
MTPNRGSNKRNALADWLTSLTINVESPSNQVYGNGRQQIKIHLDAKAYDDLSISDKEWATLRAVIEVRTFEYKELPTVSESSPWGYTTTLNSNFDFYPAQITGTLIPSPPRRRSTLR